MHESNFMQTNLSNVSSIHLAPGNLLFVRLSHPIPRTWRNTTLDNYLLVSWSLCFSSFCSFSFSNVNRCERLKIMQWILYRFQLIPRLAEKGWAFFNGKVKTLIVWPLIELRICGTYDAWELRELTDRVRFSRGHCSD